LGNKIQADQPAAHELNNPLAAMTFTLHILRTQKDMSEDTVKLLDDSVLCWIGLDHCAQGSGGIER